MNITDKNTDGSTSDTLLQVGKKDQTIILTMNRPKVMNCLNFDLLYAIKKQIDDLQYAKDIRTVIITGAGEKAFCAGADLKERLSLTPNEVKKFINSRKEPLLNGKEPKDIAPLVASSLIGDMENKPAYEKLVNSISLLHKESYLKTIDTSMRTEHRHIFKKIDVPTLIMVGELDTLTPPSMALEIQKEIKNSNIIIIPHAGHLINIEQPKKFNKSLMSFLDN